MQSFVVTPSAGKRLIAKGIVAHPAIRQVLKQGTLVIVAGTTNGYCTEEILRETGQSAGFSRSRFLRGVTLPPGQPVTDTGRLPEEKDFAGDVVLVDGRWQKGRTIFDVAGQLREGDVILKGANALDATLQRAAVLIGHPQAGTVAVALQAALGRRVRLILPVGLEKRLPGTGTLDDIAARVNAPGCKGPRLFPVPGEVFTERNAVHLLTGAQADVIAAGGVCGAEGCVWLGISGTEAQMKAAAELLRSVLEEPPFRL